MSSLEFQIHEISKSHLTPIQEFTNGIISASLANTILYPFDVARILIQTNAEDSKEDPFSTLYHLYKKYGILAWFRGNIATCIIGSTLALGNFLGISPALRDTTPLSHFLLNVAVTTCIFPFQVAKIRMITHPTKYKSTLETIQSIYNEEEFPTLFSGLTISILNTVLTGFTTMLSFRILSDFYAKPKNQPLTFWESFLLTTTASVIAAAIHYPIDTAVKIVQSLPNCPDNILRTLLNTGRVPRKSGIEGLYKGFLSILFEPWQLPLQMKFAELFRNIVFVGRPRN